MERIHYSDQLAIAAEQNIKERDYWLSNLSGQWVKTTFPYHYQDKTGSSGSERCYQSLEFAFTGDIFTGLMSIANHSDYALNILLITGLAILLHKYTDSRDVMVGMPIYRQETPGKFLNTSLPLRIQWDGDTSFKELLLQTRQTVDEAVDHQNYPLEFLFPRLHLDPGENDDFPLFDNLILLENIHPREYIHDVHCNIIFSFARKEASIDGCITYNSQRLDPAALERLVKHWHHLYRVVLASHQTSVAALDLLLPEEKEQLLSRLNNSGVGYPGDKTITRLFAEQVEKTPHQVAVSVEDDLSANRQVTYRELERGANELAAVLESKGIGSDHILGLMMGRSLELIEGILGILKAGAAYLPLDPEFPEKLNLSILEDADVPVIVTGKTALANKRFSFMQGLHTLKHQPSKTAPQKQILNFDTLPYPDRCAVDYEKYNRYIGQALVKNSISIQATRGCPYRCAYCHKIWPRHHVFRTAENLFAEVQLYYNMGVKRFVFIDDIFNVNTRNSERFFQLIIDKGMDLQLLFPNGLRGDILSEQYIDLMVKAGTIEMALALETASPRLQKLLGKNLDLEKLQKNIHYICKKYPQVILELFTMHGFPTETKEEALMTLEFIKQFKWLHFPYVHILKIYQNTDMAELALQNGISKEAIIQSENLAYHELPETLAFDKAFTSEYQTTFLNDYFLAKERLLHVLPYQMKVLTEDEILQKYNSYLPIDIDSFSALLDFAGLSREQLAVKDFLHDDFGLVPGLNQKMKQHFGAPGTAPAENKKGTALKILLLDLSQFFSNESHMLYDVVEPPLGLMYLRSYLHRQWGGKVNVRIAKSRIDFDDYGQLRQLLDTFAPDLIGIRTLTFYKDFFHQTVSLLKQWKKGVPIIAGGPYATADYTTLLQDPAIDLAVLGEGELTMSELVGKMVENGGRFPAPQVLNTIPGIAFIPPKNDSIARSSREIIIWDLLKEAKTGESALKAKAANKPGDLAYIIFTSGSTGRPKGVMIEHKNILRLMFNDQPLFDFSSREVWTMFHSHCFDFSVWEMYGALLFGGKLVVIEKKLTRDPRRILEILIKHGVTVFNQTPSAFYGLSQEALNHPGKDLIKLKTIIFGGEALKEGRLAGWKEKYPDTRLINMYGITETTVHATYKEIEPRDIESPKCNIGQPIPTLSAYIMDSDLRLKPMGAPGELFIGGSGVGRGYLNRPEMTAKKFINNPFRAGERLYRSGDLVRLANNGDLEYLGRIDNQVKIRGFRIELGEIESRLLEHREIKDVAAVLRQRASGPDAQAEAPEHSICAYWVPREPANTSLNTTLLREYLARKIPDYMIPAYFVQVDKIPLTANGKVDTNQLPAPEGLIETGVKYEPPANEIEKKLVEIWQEILMTDKVGVNDNFIDIGGDSIKAIQVEARLNHEGYRIEIVDLFLNPTIRGMAKLVKKLERTIDQAPVQGKVELTPIQRWFFENNFTDQHHYNQSVMIYSREGFDREIVRTVFARLIEHHDALRMVFKREGESVLQENRGIDYTVPNHDDFFELRVINLEAQDPATGTPEQNIEKIANEIQAGIKLHEGGLVKLGLFKTGSGDHLLMVIHHLVMDGVSWRILLEDFRVGYQQALRGETIQFQEKTDSYLDWARELTRCAESTEILKELNYWREIVETAPGPLPVEHRVPKEKKILGNQQMIHMSLNGEETQLLMKEANKAYNTEINDLLLTALAAALGQWANLERVLINLEGHGREGVIKDININRTLGWFTTQFPVLLATGKDSPSNWGERVKKTKETLRGIPQKGTGYGIIKYLLPGKKQMGLRLDVEPDISFNYLGGFGQEISGGNEGMFLLSPLSMGELISPVAEMTHAIDINGLVLEGELKLSFIYNKYEFSGNTIKKLVEKFKANLVRIIRLCSGKTQTELTKSDFSGPDFDDEEVETMYEVLEEAFEH